MEDHCVHPAAQQREHKNYINNVYPDINQVDCP